MTDFDIENVEWPGSKIAPGPHEPVLLTFPDPDDSQNGLMFWDEVVPADAYRKAVEEIGRLEAEATAVSIRTSEAWQKLETYRARIAELEKAVARFTGKEP